MAVLGEPTVLVVVVVLLAQVLAAQLVAPDQMVAVAEVALRV